MYNWMYIPEWGYTIILWASYPIAEGITGAFLTLLNNIFGVVFLLALQIPNIGEQQQRCMFTFIMLNMMSAQITPKCNVLSGDATHANFIIFSLTRLRLEPSLYHTNFMIFSLTRLGLEPSLYNTQVEHARPLHHRWGSSSTKCMYEANSIPLTWDTWILLNAKWATFKLCHSESKLHSRR